VAPLARDPDTMVWRWHIARGERQLPSPPPRSTVLRASVPIGGLMVHRRPPIHPNATLCLPRTSVDMSQEPTSTSTDATSVALGTWEIAAVAIAEDELAGSIAHSRRDICFILHSYAIILRLTLI
jgi:hypothetical protein